MKHKKLVKLFASVLSFAILTTALASCGKGGDTGNGDPSNDSHTGVSAATNPTDGATSADEIESTQRDVLNVGLEADISDFNPWSFSGTGANAAIWGLYQPLMHFANGEYYSAVLDTYEMSEDGLEMYGTLFDYVKDWEGNNITADDVVFSFEKCTEVYPEFEDLIASVEATGDYTFTMTFTRPLYVGEFDTFIRVNIVSQKAYEDSADEMHTTPVGTGPYKLTNYTSGYMFTYEKVDDFWQTDTSRVYARDMANADTVNFYVISESSQRTIALEQKTIDMCTSISSEDLEKFDGKDGYKLLSFPSNLSMALLCNCGDSSPCSDLNLRLAICYAVNNSAVLSSVYSDNGELIHEMAPTWDVGYDSAWDAEDNYYNYDPDKAADYLSQSSYNKENLVIICAADAYSTNTATLVKSFLNQIGVNADIQSYESSVFNQYIQDPDMWDIMVKTVQGNSYYVQAMYSAYSATRYASGGGLNFIYDDEFQELLSNCMPELTATDDDLTALHEYMIDHCYGMGLVNPVSYAVVPDSVSSLTLSYRSTVISGASVFSS